MKFIYTIALFLFLINSVSSQTVINKIVVEPLNRTVIYLSQQPDKFQTDLDREKTTIKISIANARSNNSKIVSNGIISEVTSAQEASNAIISAKLTDKRGYSAIYLPMSRSILLEVFDWAKLSTAEDNFRNGMLALEDGIISASKDYFLAGMNNDNPNSAALLGIINLREGKIDEALRFLNTAVNQKTNIPDAYSALAQIYQIKGDMQKSEHYKKTFKEMTGLASYQAIELGALQINNQNPVDTLSYLYAGATTETTQSSDTNTTETDTSNTSINTTKDTTIKSEPRPSILPSWLSPTVFYIVFGALLIFLMIVSSFLKWRKRQMAAITASMQKQTPKKTKFSNTLAKEEKKIVPQSKLAQAYSQPANKSTQTQKVNQSDNKVKDLAKLILENRSNADETKDTLANKMGGAKSPKVELALHLQQEQQKLKNRTISGLNKQSIPTDLNKLNETAKKLGIEKGSLNTKKMIDSLEEDKNHLNQLADKFKVKK